MKNYTNKKKDNEDQETVQKVRMVQEARDVQKVQEVDNTPKIKFEVEGTNYYIPKQEINITNNGTLYLGSGQMKESTTGVMDEDALRERINMVLQYINNSRMWFCIVKVLMLHGQLVDGEFYSAGALINRLYPAGVKNMFDPHDIAKLNTGSFKFPVSQWRCDDGPISRPADFQQYLSLAKKFEQLLIKA